MAADIDSTRSKTMNVTSSSGISSQSEAVTSQVKGDLESDVLHLEDEIAALEAELDQNIGHASLGTNKGKMTKNTDTETCDPCVSSTDLILDKSQPLKQYAISQKPRDSQSPGTTLAVTSSHRLSRDLRVIDSILNDEESDETPKCKENTDLSRTKKSQKASELEFDGDTPDIGENILELDGHLADVSFESEDDMFGPSQPSTFQIVGTKRGRFTPPRKQVSKTSKKDVMEKNASNVDGSLNGSGNSEDHFVIEETPEYQYEQQTTQQFTIKTGILQQSTPAESSECVNKGSERHCQGTKEYMGEISGVLEEHVGLSEALFADNALYNDVVESPLSPTPPSDLRTTDIVLVKETGPKSTKSNKKPIDLMRNKSSKQIKLLIPQDTCDEKEMSAKLQPDHRNKENKLDLEKNIVQKPNISNEFSEIDREETRLALKAHLTVNDYNKSNVKLKDPLVSSDNIEKTKTTRTLVSPATSVCSISSLSKNSPKSSSSSKISPKFLPDSQRSNVSAKLEGMATPRRQALQIIQGSGGTPRRERLTPVQSGVKKEPCQLWSPSLSSSMFPKKTCWTFCSTGISKIIHKPYVDKLVQLLSCKMTNKYNPTVTHVLVKPADSNPRLSARTLKYFQGIAGKAWIVSVQWCIDSVKQKRLLPEADYEIIGDTLCGANIHHAPERARDSDELILANYEICCLGSFELLKTTELREVAELCGASTVEQPTLFTFSPHKTSVVVVEQANAHNMLELPKLHKVCGVPIVAKEWLLDTVGEFELKDLNKYTIT